MKVFKKPGDVMGSYRFQYLYRCPAVSCRNEVVEPETLPALAAIDVSNPGTRIGDRPKTKDKPEGLRPKTIARIRAGIDRYWRPLLVPAGGTWRDDATTLDVPMPARTTVETDGIAIPPLIIPVEGRNGKDARPADREMRCQTTRRETAIAYPPPFVAESSATQWSKKCQWITFLQWPPALRAAAIPSSPARAGVPTPAGSSSSPLSPPPRRRAGTP